MKLLLITSSKAVRQHLVAGVAILLLGFFCASCKKEVNPADVAARAAVVYYENLIKGDAEQFVDGSAQIDSIPADYRDAQIASVKMYMEQIRQTHGGLAHVELDTATVSTDGNEADVTLRFHYADSTVNRVLVPMVCRKGLWLLR